MKQFRSLFLLILLCVFLCSIAACRQSPSSTSDNRVKIVTTLFIHYDTARAVAGDYADITLLLPPGTESHDFDPTPGNVVDICNANLFLYSGSFETFSARVLDQIDPDRTLAVDMSKGISLISPDDSEADHDHDAHEVDQHYWTNPLNVIIMTNTVCDALIQADPEHEEDYRANAALHIAELQTLDHDFRSLLSNSSSKKLIVASQFPFLYFCREYGLSYLAAYDTCAEHSEPSVKRVTQMIDTIREEKIPAVYYKEFANTSLANTIAEGSGAKIYLLHSAHNVSAEDFKNGVTYIQLMQQNLKNLAEGFCQ